MTFRKKCNVINCKIKNAGKIFLRKSAKLYQTIGCQSRRLLSFNLARVYSSFIEH